MFMSVYTHTHTHDTQAKNFCLQASKFNMDYYIFGIGMKTDFNLSFGHC